MPVEVMMSSIPFALLAQGEECWALLVWVVECRTLDRDHHAVARGGKRRKD